MPGCRDAGMFNNLKNYRYEERDCIIPVETVHIHHCGAGCGTGRNELRKLKRTYNHEDNNINHHSLLGGEAGADEQRGTD